MGFIYVHPFAKYLLIENPASLLTLPFNDKWDLHVGFEKTLQLLRKSNTTPFE